MRYRSFAAPFFAVFLALVGCSDEEPRTPSEPQFSHTASASCDFNFNSLIAQFFIPPRQGVVFGLKQQMETAHAASSETDVQKYGFEILANLEAAVNAKESSNATAGSDLANRVLACMFRETELSPVILPVDFTQELTIDGLGAFAVRGGATSYDTAGPVFAHDGFSGVTPANSATWSAVLSARTLMYGERASGTTESYDWFKILRSTTFISPYVIVGLCVPAGSNDMLLEDNSSVLAFDGTHFGLPCQVSAMRRSSDGSTGWGPFDVAQRLVRLFAPTSLHAAAVFTNTTSGKAGSFSNFRSDFIEAATSEYLVPPPATVLVNVVVTPTIEVKVTADNMPAVNQLVMLKVATQISNKGTNVEVGGETAITNSSGVATFPNFVIKKAGTYTIEASFALGRPGVAVTYASASGIQAGGTGKKK